MQAEASAALVAARREERIERFTSGTEIHAAATIGKRELRHCPFPKRLNLDLHRNLPLPVGKRGARRPN